MAVYEYNSQEEMDEGFERIEDINMEYVDLKEAAEEARKDLAEAEKELSESVGVARKSKECIHATL